MLATDGLWGMSVQRAAATPDALLAVDEDGRELSFAGYVAAAERAAAALHASYGVTTGSVVTWQLPTWLESLVLVGALARLGAVQNPVLPIYREREVGFVTRQAGAGLLIVPPVWRGFDYPAMAAGLGLDGVEILVCDRSLPEGDPATLPPPPGTGSDPVRWVFYTSGTTADPKGAQHTDATIAATARGMAQRLDFGPDDRNSLLFPFTHIGGITWLFASLLTGGGNILMEAFEPERAVEVLRRAGVTMAGSGTYFHMSYLKAQRARAGEALFPRLRNCPGGGAPKPPQLHHDIKKELGGAGILSGWGLTEAPILSMATYDDPDDTLAHTEGRAMPGVDLRVIALDGRPAGPGEEGELRARAPQLMKGYVDSALDADAFDEDGYFRTGDLGRIDGDGYVTITGRLKDVIIRNGENISAKELEDLLFTHDAVADVAVIGIADPLVGERACAVVVAQDPAAPPSLATLTDFLRGKGLMTQKLPERLELVDALPRNPAGKVLKAELRVRYAP